MTCYFIFYVAQIMILGDIRGYADEYEYTHEERAVATRECSHGLQDLERKLLYSCHRRRGWDYSVTWGTIPPAVDMRYEDWSE